MNKDKKPMPKHFLLAFLIPMLFGKLMILYFGSNYSAYPDQGYGKWLAGSICFTLLMIARFLWKYRNYED